MDPVHTFQAFRLRQGRDENAALSAKTTNSTATDSQKPTGLGLKAAARRTAFNDLSNTANPVSKTTDKDNSNAVVLQEKKTKIAGAISKPAQRMPIVKPVVPLNSFPQPRRTALKTAVYKDRRISPKRNSPPKVSRDAIVKKESQQLPVNHLKQQATRRPSSSNLSKSKQPEAKEDTVFHSDQIAHLYSDNYIDEDEDNNGVGLNDDYDDETDTEQRLGGKLGVISDFESDGDYEDTEYLMGRSRAGDNTTGITAQVLLPKWTARERQEMKAIQKEFLSFEDDEEGDISMVAEYGDEIFEYMRELEIKLLPNANYMDHQSEIQWSMRAILMDWLVQVHSRFGLLPETLFLCSNYVDRFLSTKVVSLGKLQLVGATALFVAAKYEEINCPSVMEIVYMVDGGYTVEEILKAERFMLTMLQYQLGWPGPMSFLRRVSKADDYDLETRTLAKYFLEMSVMDERFVGTPPSFLAAGAHCLARHMLRKGEWTTGHAFYSGYTASQLEPLIHTLVECCENPKVHHNAVYEKFTDRRYKRASLYVENWMQTEAGIFTEA